MIVHKHSQARGRRFYRYAVKGFARMADRSDVYQIGRGGLGFVFICPMVSITRQVGPVSRHNPLHLVETPQLEARLSGHKPFYQEKV